MKLLKRFFEWCEKVILSIFGGNGSSSVPTKVHDFRSPRLGHSIYFSVRLEGEKLSVMGHGCNNCNAGSVGDPRCHIEARDGILIMKNDEEHKYYVEKIAYARDPRDMFTAELRLIRSSSGSVDE
jgi:hypothetical protein